MKNDAELALVALMMLVPAVFGESIVGADLAFTQQERVWKNREEDPGGVHVLGNGSLCAYEQGPNIMQLFGPPYSSPSLGALTVEDPKEMVVRSRRLLGAAIWRHRFEADGKPIGEAIDFVDSQSNVLLRRTNLTDPVDFTLKTHPRSVALMQDRKFHPLGASNALYIEIEAGSSIYGPYPAVTERGHAVISAGACSIAPGSDTQTWKIRCGKGEGMLYLVGAADYPRCVVEAEGVLPTPWEEAFARTRDSWQTFTDRRNDFARDLSRKTDRLDRVLETIDDIAVLIKAQQGRDGGVLAGHAYHLGYVRDQYGVSRALLKMGYFDEARLMLTRYAGIHRELGRIHNAHGIDVGGISHVHENDDVELTGYIIVQAFNYLDNTGDRDLLREIFPLLEWCWEAQKLHLVDGMLPFNGDETYVAGGILPRWCLLDGSAESTLLFVTGGTRLLDFVGREDLWTTDRLAENKRILNDVRDRFQENFWEEGRLLTNNPARRLGDNASKMPRFRHGVQEDTHGWGWGERNENGRYCSPAGIDSETPLPFADPKKFSLISVSMVPLYLGADLLTAEQLEPTIDELVRQVHETGNLSSVPGGDRTVGHEFGLLLYSIAETGRPGGEEVFDKMLAVLDSTGSWVEYYVNDRPTGCRCRPWESGINLEALLRYLER